MAKRQRRKFTDEYKAEAVRLVREGGTSIRQISRDLDLTESSLRNWVKQAEIDAGKGPSGALTTDELAELRRLRREVKLLRMEREVLKNDRVPAPLLLGQKLPQCSVGLTQEARPFAYWCRLSPLKNMARG
ncbi:MAG: transposase [Deltaproteobacteria bacterium]|nr:transposase [Deltaproteobacteria bacterium]